MEPTHHSIRRALSAVVLATGGLALSAAIWASGNHGFAAEVLSFYGVASIVTYRWAGGRGDVAAILSTRPDERQRGLDRDATAISGLAVTVVALVGAVVAVARTGNPGDFGVICLVSGASYVIALGAMRRRR